MFDCTVLRPSYITYEAGEVTAASFVATENRLASERSVSRDQIDLSDLCKHCLHESLLLCMDLGNLHIRDHLL